MAILRAKMVPDQLYHLMGILSKVSNVLHIEQHVHLSSIYIIFTSFTEQGVVYPADKG